MLFTEPVHAVIVCARALDKSGEPRPGFDDYLEITLSQNRPMLDHVVIVTTPDDAATRKVAGAHGCDILITHEGREPGKFRKGELVERGMQQLPGDGWWLQIDVDILLPGNFRMALAAARLRRECLYGCDRFDVSEREGLEALKRTGWLDRGWQWQHYLRGVPTNFKHSSRLVHHDQGWLPIGFLQLAHTSALISNGVRHRPYTRHSADAGHDDVQYAMKWDRQHRVLIPEFLVAHLVTEDAKFGSNWEGRRTRRFDAPAPTQAGKKEQCKPCPPPPCPEPGPTPYNEC